MPTEPAMPKSSPSFYQPIIDYGKLAEEAERYLNHKAFTSIHRELKDFIRALRITDMHAVDVGTEWRLIHWVQSKYHALGWMYRGATPRNEKEAVLIPWGSKLDDAVSTLWCRQFSNGGKGVPAPPNAGIDRKEWIHFDKLPYDTR
jgi:hypothetical protein